MRNTSTFIPNLLTPAQYAGMQAVFDQVCEEFEFGPSDKDARDRIAAALMWLPSTSRTTDQALKAARQTARDIIKERRVSGLS